jgi:alkylhydroperoxidase family enzyme
VSDEIYESVKSHFNDQEMTELTMAIGLINLWNRFAAPFASTPGGMDKVMGLEKANLK